MTKTLFSLTFLLLTVSACSGKQKRICNQNVAYQHGYQAAQKGESVDNASTNQANVCQDFEAYNTSLYRQDFKAGYFKGKKDYCSEINYKKWGSDDGQKGKETFPNNYSVAMKICLQDPESKALAKKTYWESFNEAYCDEGRMQELGQAQAKDFAPLKTPNIKKRCGNEAGGMIAAMRTAYKEQMKTNCTTGFWLLKGEEDAKAKKSKATEISKVQKCPATVRDKLMTNYSKAYNDRRALMLEEEKLALEKKRQEERMQLEREKQRQQYELEKERIQVVRDTINTGISGGRPSNRPHYFYHKGRRLSSTCEVNRGDREAHISVRNETNRHFSLSGNWRIDYYDRSGRRIKTNTERELLIFSSHEREDFEDNFAPYDAYRCEARFNS